jgi:DNA uptake protein ComE-like DNA-binding protein
LPVFASAIYFTRAVNINSADAQTLASLKGNRPAKPAAIVADRGAKEPLSSAKDLVRIEGIVPRREMNKDMMTFNDEPVQ